MIRTFALTLLLHLTLFALTTHAQNAAKKDSPAKNDPNAPSQGPLIQDLQHSLLSESEIQAGWLRLFDGETLFGWTPNNPEIDWHVESGTIVSTKGPIGLLLTTVPFADYEFRCEYRMDAGGNSGVFLRTIPDPKEVTKDCYELNMVDAHPMGFLTGSLVGRQKTPTPLIGSGGWRSIYARVEGNRFIVHIDGQPVLDYRDETPHLRRSGLIGLQHNQGKIEFRNVLLRPLGLKNLLAGNQLSGWHVVPGSKSEFTPDDGTVRVKNGQGFLETDEQWADFIIQVDSQTHGKELNSGFFFRAMKGTEKEPSNGYEVQIHNGFADGDRNKPTNAGTGAIFRRVNARRVVSDDGQWSTTTLAADGPRFAVWVNGLLVVDWVDTRSPNENPRRGQRLAAGHISLQGHDPTTDLSFRNIRIAPLPSK